MYNYGIYIHDAHLTQHRSSLNLNNSYYYRAMRISSD